MITVDLVGRGYPPLNGRSPTELFELAVQIALSLDDVRVHVPVGDRPDETVVLDSRVLRKDGVKLF